METNELFEKLFAYAQEGIEYARASGGKVLMSSYGHGRARCPLSWYVSKASQKDVTSSEVLDFFKSSLDLHSSDDIFIFTDAFDDNRLAKSDYRERCKELRLRNLDIIMD